MVVVTSNQRDMILDAVRQMYPGNRHAFFP
jgi:hypothetical protein